MDKDIDNCRSDMTPKELLIQEIDDAPELLIIEVLDFLQFLKTRQMEDTADLNEAKIALASVASEGTVSWEDLKADISS
ncbi:MAG: hypothetical protein AAGF66_20005 [Cyanobacteria bacterium P01_H01_bin.119]